MLYGGQTNAGRGNRSIDGDAWIWNGRTWQTVCSTCPPGRRAGVAMAGNGTSVLLFGGGQVGATNSALGDTWQLRDGNWTRVGAGGAPAVWHTVRRQRPAAASADRGEWGWPRVAARFAPRRRNLAGVV